jgi:hypothetical protein
MSFCTSKGFVRSFEFSQQNWALYIQGTGIIYGIRRKAIHFNQTGH